MSYDEALNILIASAVCVCPQLYCDDDCPFGQQEECNCELTNEVLKKAVKRVNKELKEVKEKVNDN